MASKHMMVHTCTRRVKEDRRIIRCCSSSSKSGAPKAFVLELAGCGERSQDDCSIMDASMEHQQMGIHTWIDGTRIQEAALILEEETQPNLKEAAGVRVFLLTTLPAISSFARSFESSVPPASSSSSVVCTAPTIWSLYALVCGSGYLALQGLFAIVVASVLAAIVSFVVLLLPALWCLPLLHLSFFFLLSRRRLPRLVFVGACDDCLLVVVSIGGSSSSSVFSRVFCTFS
jgi:hypothetical protein